MWDPSPGDSREPTALQILASTLEGCVLTAASAWRAAPPQTWAWTLEKLSEKACVPARVVSVHASWEDITPALQ